MRNLQSAWMWISVLAVLAIGVVVLSGRVAPHAPRPAAIGSEGESIPWRVERPTIPRPQVLQAQSAAEEDTSAAAVTSPFQQPPITSPYQAPATTVLPDHTQATPTLAAPLLETTPITAPLPDVGVTEQPAEETPVPGASTGPSITETQRIVTTEADSFWSISERLYGSSAYYRALFHHNQSQVLRPDQLRAGMSLEIPPLDTLRALYPSDCP